MNSKLILMIMRTKTRWMFLRKSKKNLLKGPNIAIMNHFIISKVFKETILIIMTKIVKLFRRMLIIITSI